MGGRDGGRCEGAGGGRLGETPETSQEEEGSKLMDVTARCIVIDKNVEN